MLRECPTGQGADHIDSSILAGACDYLSPVEVPPFLLSRRHLPKLTGHFLSAAIDPGHAADCNGGPHQSHAGSPCQTPRCDGGPDSARSGGDLQRRERLTCPRLHTLSVVAQNRVGP